MEEREHVSCHSAEIVICGHFGERDTVGEPVDGEGVANAKGAGDVTLVALVVVK